jgi:hypothetical protein
MASTGPRKVLDMEGKRPDGQRREKRREMERERLCEQKSSLDIDNDLPAAKAAKADDQH